jgi:hypothetical protein
MENNNTILYGKCGWKIIIQYYLVIVDGNNNTILYGNCGWKILTYYMVILDGKK